MARVAMFLPRSPRPPMTGRKTGIHAAIAALAEENHEVDLFVVANAPLHDGQPGTQASAPERRAVWLGMPRKPLVLRNAAVSVLSGRYSLNEALFRSGRLLAEARRLRGAYDFAVADTIRVAAYANELGVPWHLDLDDLYSTRYERYLKAPEELSPGLLLGYYRDHAPAIAAAFPAALLKRLLTGEAARLRRREVFWAKKASTVSLASPEESERFSALAARPVHSALMSSARIPQSRWTPEKVNGGGAVFLGGLDYKPNLDALLYYQDAVFPLLKAARCALPRLSHLGNAPAELRRRFSPEAVQFEGYVNDIVPRLRQAPCFVAPIVSGTGIKTKVLEAMALGMPVLATPEAVSGLQVEHRTHCFICRRPADFAEGMRLVADRSVSEAMGLNARRYVEGNFSSDVLRQRWRRVMQELAAC